VFVVLDLLIVACVESYIYTQSPNSKTLGSSIKAESQLAAALWCTLGTVSVYIGYITQKQQQHNIIKHSKTNKTKQLYGF
jgi:hypothetical protein